VALVCLNLKYLLGVTIKESRYVVQLLLYWSCAAVTTVKGII
jgi:hypothetical protein